uniref:Uncharacterized protein n=1 Tax=Trypanosoma vivax (strain Y486) TaxID=1055687 RepID=G0U088_TRYVY|nr:hypothetical protein, unlikely [Trypanosoma vivax Y486]
MNEPVMLYSTGMHVGAAEGLKYQYTNIYTLQKSTYLSVGMEWSNKTWTQSVREMQYKLNKGATPYKRSKTMGTRIKNRTKQSLLDGREVRPARRANTLQVHSL